MDEFQKMTEIRQKRPYNPNQIKIQNMNPEVQRSGFFSRRRKNGYEVAAELSFYEISNQGK